MAIKHREKHAQPQWEYPEELEPFLAVIGARLDDPTYAAFKLDLFMHCYGARVMPAALRQVLIRRGLLDPRARNR
jgi:hypothetical protein